MPQPILVAITCACVSCLVCATAPGQLPGVTPPKEESVEPGQPPDPEEQEETRPRVTVKIQGAAKPQPEPPAEQPIHFDALMKSVADPKLPMPLATVQQLRELAPFSRLSVEQQNAAVGELLALLGSTTALPRTAGTPGAPAFQVRHRANVALVAIARVHFGQFATGDVEEKGHAEEIVARWTSWWKEAAPLDAKSRGELAARLRKSLYGTKDEDAFWINVRFADEDRDAAPLAQLAKRLAAADLRDPSQTNKAISLYGSLCQAPGAPADAGLVLVEFLRRHNTPSVAGDEFGHWWLRMAAVYLRRITRVSEPYLEAREVDIGQGSAKQTTTVHMVTDEAIRNWENAIRAQAAAAKERAPETPQEDTK